MDPTWITAFLDFPGPLHRAGTAFWQAVTGAGLSPVRGENEEFATLLPGDGDAFLRVQRIESDFPGIHLDLHASEEPFAPQRSPGGLAWCAVPGERLSRPAPVTWPGGHASLVDQLCLDIPPASYDEECAYWAGVTGWELRETSAPEMRQLVRPAGMPLRILLQRRFEGEGPVTAHLDLATTDRDAEVARHLELGASIDGGGPRWTRMRDVAGALYCITDRDPATGLLP
jgi:hypothetical protein